MSIEDKIKRKRAEAERILDAMDDGPLKDEARKTLDQLDKVQELKEKLIPDNLNAAPSEFTRSQKVGDKGILMSNNTNEAVFKIIEEAIGDHKDFTYINCVGGILGAFNACLAYMDYEEIKRAIAMAAIAMEAAHEKAEVRDGEAPFMLLGSETIDPNLYENKDEKLQV